MVAEREEALTNQSECYSLQCMLGNRWRTGAQTSVSEIKLVWTFAAISTAIFAPVQVNAQSSISPTASIINTAPIVTASPGTPVGPSATWGSPSNPRVRFRLANGLDVILEENHRIPQVAVRMNYHTGSRNDPAGFTGLAHTVEHMMFERSGRGPLTYVLALEALGATDINATTQPDRTEYFCTVPAHNLPRVLWAESDRMAYLLQGLDERRLRLEQRAITNEYQLRVGNQVGGFLGRYLREAMYPATHPYRHIDELPEDLAEIHLPQVQWFFQQWYGPANATLVLVGDFQIAQVRPMIEQYFGQIVGGTPPHTTPPSLTQMPGQRLVMQYAGEIDLVGFFWQTPKFLERDDAALDLIADLINDETTGLQHLLVRELNVAQGIIALQSSSELQSEFIVFALLARGHTATEVIRAMDAQLDRLQNVSLDPATVQTLASTQIRQIEALNHSLSIRASMLSTYSAFGSGDPDLTPSVTARYNAMTPAVIQEVSRRWLARQHRVTIITQRAEGSRQGTILQRTAE